MIHATLIAGNTTLVCAVIWIRVSAVIWIHVTVGGVIHVNVVGLIRVSVAMAILAIVVGAIRVSVAMGTHVIQPAPTMTHAYMSAVPVTGIALITIPVYIQSVQTTTSATASVVHLSAILCAGITTLIAIQSALDMTPVIQRRIAMTRVIVAMAIPVTAAPATRATVGGVIHVNADGRIPVTIPAIVSTPATIPARILILAPVVRTLLCANAIHIARRVAPVTSRIQAVTSMK